MKSKSQIRQFIRTSGLGRWGLWVSVLLVLAALTFLLAAVLQCLSLRKQEDALRETQVKTAQELLQVQAARRAFEDTLKEMLRAVEDAQLDGAIADRASAIRFIRERFGTP